MGQGGKDTDSKRYVALLRAVNVGGRNRVPMAALRELLSGLGYGEVRTHLQSGNALFLAPADSSGGASTNPSGGASTNPSGGAGAAEAIEREIDAALAGHLGVSARVLLRTRPQLARAIADNPLRQIATDPRRLLVMFLAGSPDRAAWEDLALAELEPEVYALGERELYAWYPDGFGQTRRGNAFWERRLGVAATGRNWSTVTRLLELLDA
jgi:uncharacterized protein (DUF1697 family)